MKTYKDLKSVSYIEPAIHFVERLLDVQFKRTAENRYSAFCPFHADNQGSFRVYLMGQDEVKFLCFCGDCRGILGYLRPHNASETMCGFKRAQEDGGLLYLGIKDFKSIRVAKSNNVPVPDEELRTGMIRRFYRSRNLTRRLLSRWIKAPAFTINFCYPTKTDSGKFMPIFIAGVLEQI
jgi:hypothetical protein